MESFFELVFAYVAYSGQCLYIPVQLVSLPLLLLSEEGQIIYFYFLAVWEYRWSLEPEFALSEDRELRLQACSQRHVACISANQVHDMRVGSLVKKELDLGR